MLAMIAAVALSAPAAAQDAPASLYEPAPAQDAGTAAPSDGDRSTLLLGLALAALAGAGLLAVLALRRPATPRTNTEIVDEALAVLAAGETPEREPATPPAKPTRRFRAARAASIEASASARSGMPVILEPRAQVRVAPAGRRRAAAPGVRSRLAHRLARGSAAAGLGLVQQRRHVGRQAGDVELFERDPDALAAVLVDQHHVRGMLEVEPLVVA